MTGGDDASDELMEDLDLFGITDEAYRQQVAGFGRAAPYAIWPSHDTALRLFLMCATQWRVSPMGEALGLEYGSVESVMRLEEVEEPRELFRQIRLIEHGALQAMRKVRA